MKAEHYNSDEASALCCKIVAGREMLQLTDEAGKVVCTIQSTRGKSNLRVVSCFHGQRVPDRKDIP